MQLCESEQGRRESVREKERERCVPGRRDATKDLVQLQLQLLALHAVSNRALRTGCVFHNEINGRANLLAERTANYKE